MVFDLSIKDTKTLLLNNNIYKKPKTPYYVSLKKIREKGTWRKVLIYSKSFNKGEYTTQNPFLELGLTQVEVLSVRISEVTAESLNDTSMDLKAIDGSKNMFALGLILWLYNKDIKPAEELLKGKFGKKPSILEANLKVLTDGYNYGHSRGPLHPCRTSIWCTWHFLCPHH